MRRKDDSRQMLLYVKDLMEILDIGKDRAYALMHSNSFPSMQIGRTYCVTMSNLEAWLEKNTGKAITL